jgi:PIN domain nuclease of toxin-antitoxin system
MGLGLDRKRHPYAAQEEVTCILDTHFLIWILSDSKRLKRFPWLDSYQPWRVSPASLLEIQILHEVGRLELTKREFAQAVKADSRFVIDDASWVAVTLRSLELSWTRDPFDRWLAAHSLVRRTPLCTVDSDLLDHHKSIVPELR